MVRHKIIGLFILATAIMAPVLTLRAATFGSFGVGGKITATQTDLQATITCAATYGPFIVRPVNLATPGPYFIRTSLTQTPKRNGYFLGLYKPIPDVSTCYNPETGAPVPAFEIKIYGVSR